MEIEKLSEKEMENATEVDGQLLGFAHVEIGPVDVVAARVRCLGELEDGSGCGAILFAPLAAELTDEQKSNPTEIYETAAVCPSCSKREGSPIVVAVAVLVGGQVAGLEDDEEEDDEPGDPADAS